MDGETLDKINRYIRYYNKIKKDKDFRKFHINKNSGAHFYISETKDEILIVFLINK
jgi:hypothetical protein